jgi:phage gp36-like protein
VVALPLYASAEDVRVVVARNPTRYRGTAAEMDDNEINYALEQAEAEVNGRLRQRYTIPFPTPVPLLVKSIVTDIAAYRATLTYRQNRDLEPTDPIALRYRDSRQLLAQIADGNLDLDSGDGGSAVTSTGSIGRPVNRNQGNLFRSEDFGLSWRNRTRRGGWL